MPPNSSETKNRKNDLILCIQKINERLKSKEICNTDIETLKQLFIQYKKPCFLMGLLSFYEKCKQKLILEFIAQHIDCFKNDYSDKINQLFIIFSFWSNQPIENRRMAINTEFMQKYRKICPDWFFFDYFKHDWFNPICAVKLDFKGQFMPIHFQKFNLRNILQMHEIAKLTNDLEKVFLEGYCLICSDNYLLAIKKFTNLLMQLKMHPKNIGFYLHTYHLISFAYFYIGNFVESIFYLEMAGKLYQLDYFTAIINTIKGIKFKKNIYLKEFNTFYPKITKLAQIPINLITQKRLLFNLLISQHPFLCDLIYEESEKLVFLITKFTKNTFITTSELEIIFKELISNFNILSIRKIQNKIRFMHYPSMQVQEMKIDYENILINYKNTFKISKKDFIEGKLNDQPKNTFKINRKDLIEGKLNDQLKINRNTFKINKKDLIEGKLNDQQKINRKEDFIEEKRSLNDQLKINRNTFKINKKDLIVKPKQLKIIEEKRSKLNDQLNQLINQVNEELMDYKTDYLLIYNTEFCFEQCIKLQNSIRIPRITYLYTQLEHKNNPKYYLLDPTNQLPNTQKRLLPYLNFPGCTGKPINTKEVPNPVNFYYFGHGNGNLFLKSINFNFLALFGCSSAKRYFYEGSNPHGLMYKSNVSCFVGCLWDVSDKDLDRMTVSFVKREIVCREGLKWRWLNGAAVVVYGEINK